jgi:hypothetical protein
MGMGFAMNLASELRVRDRDVAGSNPAAPTINLSYSQPLNVPNTMGTHLGGYLGERI